MRQHHLVPLPTVVACEPGQGLPPRRRGGESLTSFLIKRKAQHANITCNPLDWWQTSPS